MSLTQDLAMQNDLDCLEEIIYSWYNGRYGELDIRDFLDFINE